LAFPEQLLLLLYALPELLLCAASLSAKSVAVAQVESNPT